MRPSEVRQTILEDHEKLREELAELARISLKVATAEPGDLAPLLRDRGEAFLEHFLRHLALEDAHLKPAVRDADGWGEARAQRLEDEHTHQRQLLEGILGRLRDESFPEAELALELRGLVEVIREDMQQEEKVMLDANLLRDDVVGVDVEAG